MPAGGSLPVFSSVLLTKRPLSNKIKKILAEFLRPQPQENMESVISGDMRHGNDTLHEISADNFAEIEVEISCSLSQKSGVATFLIQVISLYDIIPRNGWKGGGTCPGKRWIC